LAVSQATFDHLYGPAFFAEYLDRSKPSHEQHHRIFQLMRTGYEALFRLADKDDAAYVHQRTTGSPFKDAKERGGMTIGVHVRRGDVHPWQREFDGDYLPLSRYMDEVQSILHSTYDSHSNFNSNTAHPSFSSAASTPNVDLRRRQSLAALQSSITLLSSDDPLTYSSSETAGTIRAQDRIVLASKQALESMSGGRPTGPLDSVSGWEGGFYKDVFLSLGYGMRATQMPPSRPVLKGRNVRSEEMERFEGALHHHAADSAGGGAGHEAWLRSRHHAHHHHHQPEAGHVAMDFAPENMALRAMVGRAYLLDLAVLGQADAVVCGVSSAACRVLGVMMGWDAVREGRWRNVDGGWGWRGEMTKSIEVTGIRGR
jgi:hypothetical protein